MNVRDELDLLPLRQLVALGGESPDAFGDRSAWDCLSRPGSFRIVSHGRGGQILACSERSLADARSVLRQAYGGLVRFGTPTVHTYVDPQKGGLMLPVVYLRVDAPRPYAAALQNALAECGCSVQGVDRRRDALVIRAELELARALGLQERIGELTDGTALVLSWLAGYRAAGASETNKPPP
jgi:hypothetical protein